jgi:hypothetical protein
MTFVRKINISRTCVFFPQSLHVLIKTTFLTFLVLICVGCESSRPKPNSSLTHGQVQMSLVKGVTSQTQVLEIFGSPNVTSLDAQGHEVWTYQRHASSSKESAAYASLGLIGGSVGGFEQSSRAMTLIIKFNSQKVVSDFNSLYSSF